jgi:Cdc6-like AAA superfamily ATPase
MGYRPRPLLLYGPPGTGKTSLANEVADDLAQGSHSLKVCYVNCWVDHSTFRILYSIVQQIASPLLIHRKGTPTDELVERWEKVLATSRCLVILDEVDQLQDKDALYMLAKPGVGLVLIADTEGALVDMSMRTRSRLGSLEMVSFGGYSPEELLSILRERRRLALFPDAISDDQLNAIALSADGDARRAIEALRFACEMAQRNDENAVSEADISQAIPAAKKASSDRGLSKLNMHQRVLYSIVQDAREIDSAELYRRYYEQVADPVQERALRNYLQQLAFYGFVQSRGVGRWRVYFVAE